MDEMRVLYFTESRKNTKFVLLVIAIIYRMHFRVNNLVPVAEMATKRLKTRSVLRRRTRRHHIFAVSVTGRRYIDAKGGPKRKPNHREAPKNKARTLHLLKDSLFGGFQPWPATF